MAFDFPASPTNGQTFTPAGGPTYVWDGTAWRVSMALGTDAPFDMTAYLRSNGTWASGGRLSGALQVRTSAVGLAPDAGSLIAGGISTDYAMLWNNYYSGGTYRRTTASYAAAMNLNPTNGAMELFLAGNDAANSTPTYTRKFMIEQNGSITASLDVQATRHLSSSGHVFTNDGVGMNIGGYYGDASTWYVSALTGNPNWGNLQHYMIHVPGAWVGWRYYIGSEVYDFRNAGLAYKVGGGAWLDISDRRIKEEIADYPVGLDAVAALRPVQYRFKGNDTFEKPEEEPRVGQPFAKSTHAAVAIERKTFIGLIAQEVELLIPAMVSKSKGFIDGEAVDDLRSLDTTPLLFALINAVKELKARVEELEAANGV